MVMPDKMCAMDCSEHSNDTNFVGTTVVLLGASNLSINTGLLVENILRGFSGPIRLLMAAGHGRSFGVKSRVFFRELPGILECGLWDVQTKIASQYSSQESSQSSQSSGQRLKLLLTDIGNDLVYGFSAAEIIAWVETCLDRFNGSSENSVSPENIVLTLPPIAALRKLSRWRYGVMRRFLFPMCNISFEAIQEGAEKLAAGLERMGRERSLQMLAPPAEWYGFDPIHLMRRHRSSAWRAVLNLWADFDDSDWRSDVSKTVRQTVRVSRPALRRMRGRVQTASQPTRFVGQEEQNELWSY